MVKSKTVKVCKSPTLLERSSVLQSLSQLTFATPRLFSICCALGSLDQNGKFCLGKNKQHAVSLLLAFVSLLLTWWCRFCGPIFSGRFCSFLNFLHTLVALVCAQSAVSLPVEPYFENGVPDQLYSTARVSICGTFSRATTTYTPSICGTACPTSLVQPRPDCPTANVSVAFAFFFFLPFFNFFLWLLAVVWLHRAPNFSGVIFLPLQALLPF